MLALRGVKDARAIAAALPPGSVFLDLKVELDEMYRGYLRETMVHSLLGAAAIAALLFMSLRSPRRVLDVAAPLAAAALATSAPLALGGGAVDLSPRRLLLVVALGSNYALFRPQGRVGPRPRAHAGFTSFAATTTVIGFGVLASSRIPVLNALGTTVAGAAMALAFAAVEPASEG